MEEGRSMYKVLAGMPEGKRPLRRLQKDRDQWDELDSAGSI
jgi:hypothetical protein